MKDFADQNISNSIIDWNVESMAREIRYTYYAFAVVFWERERARNIVFNETDVILMLRKTNEALRRVYKRKSENDVFSSYFDGRHKLDMVKIAACDSQYISNLFFDDFRLLCLSDADWSWLSKENERAVNFAWSFIVDLGKQDLNQMLDDRLPLMRYLINNYPSARDIHEKDVHPYRLMKFDYDLPDTKLKYDSLVSFFDFLGLFKNRLDCDKVIDAKRKSYVIECMKHLWLCSVDDFSMINWTSKNKEYLSWAWQYYLKTMEDGLVPYWFCTKFGKDYAKLLILAYDLLSIDYSSKKLFMTRLAKACAQEKYRESLSSKKQVSFSIRADVKDKLDKLAEGQGKKLYELIEQLIEREYEAYKDQ
jgi:hypothetical protein